MNVMTAVMNMLAGAEIIVHPHEIVTPARFAGYKSAQLGKIEDLCASTKGKPCIQFECSNATVQIFLEGEEGGLKDTIKRMLLEAPINLPDKFRSALQVAFKGGKVGGREDERSILDRIAGDYDGKRS